MESDSDEMVVGTDSESEVEAGSESETEMEAGKESGTELDAGNESGTELDAGKEEDIEIGKAVRDQLKLWDSLLCIRIQVQKVLVAANKLPAPALYALLHDDLQKNTPNSISNVLKQFSNNLLDLQEMLIEQNPETRKILASNNSDNTGLNEEITSSEDETVDLNLDALDENVENSSDFEDDNKKETVNRKVLTHISDKTLIKKSKRKRKKARHGGNLVDTVVNRFDSLIPFRNDTIEKWNTKTEVASGKFKNKGSNFSSFHVSAMKQINQILSDKERLIKRTQLKRSQYVPIGESDAVKKTKNDDRNTESNEKNEQTEYNDEIFDDDDFYHQLLREVIERKAANVEDLADMNSRLLELQKLRGKNKKKVDTKSSKGRKIRYTVHNKLVNFMAPYDSNPMTEGAYKELLNSLFSSG